VSLSVDKRIVRLKDSGELYAKLVVDNFTDELGEYGAYYPLPGRTIYLGLGYRY
jgi:hypothetical protein